MSRTETASQVEPDRAFVFDRVSVRLGNALVLDQVTCCLPARACTAVVGASGAGKSTLLRLLVRLSDPSSGTIAYHGQSMETIDVLDLRRRVQLVPQQPVLLAQTVLSELRIGRPQLTNEQAGELLSGLDLPRSLLGRATQGLSGGQAARVCLARALAMKPETLLLDEPTASLDRTAATAVENRLKSLVEQGHTLVLVTHDAQQARRLAQHLVILHPGGAASAGSPSHLDGLDLPQ